MRPGSWWRPASSICTPMASRSRPVASWYERQARKGRVLNYGAATNWAFARIGAMTGSNAESSLEAFGNAMRDRRWIDNVASDAEVAGILDRLANGLNEGGI